MEIYSEALAKMFAAENIAIQIKESPTAYFDIEKRRMTIPKWILQLPKLQENYSCYMKQVMPTHS